MPTDPATLIREMLAYAGLSQSEMARRLGVPASSVSRWASGAVEPAAGVLLKIARECGYAIRRGRARKQ